MNLSLTPEQVGLCLREVGLGFMFAPNHHPAMKHAAPVRKELGMRTILNILGPLTNPAGAPNQVMGVFHPDLVGIQARVLQMLGSRHVLTVHGADGLDEITITGPTHVAELRDGNIIEYGPWNPGSSVSRPPPSRPCRSRGRSNHGPACSRCWPTSPAPRATSSSSMPRRRCTSRAS